MRIATWNVNGIRACRDKGFFSFLQEWKPDVFCVQETKAHPEQVEPDLRAPSDYLSYWSAAARRGYSGVATFTKVKPLSVERGIGIRKYDEEGRFVLTAYPDFCLYNVYFPNGASGPDRHNFKQEFLHRFLRHLRKQIGEGRQIILCGDYNVAHEPQDVFDPERLASVSGFLPEERAWFDEFLAAGFVDVFRHFSPTKKHQYTWWSYREKARIGNRGWRIDYICVTKGLMSRVQSCEILAAQGGSDHCPVIMEMADV